MSEPDLVEMPQAQLGGETSLLSWQASLLDAGAQHLDPSRFHYLEVLSQRIDTTQGEVRRILEKKLKDALTDYDERFRLAQVGARAEVATLSGRHPELARELQRFFAAGNYGAMRQLGTQAAFNTPSVPLTQLTQLTQHIENAKQGGRDPRLESSLVSGMEASSEMASVRRFREAWSRIAAENQVDQAVERGPVNAGPLNSHLLVLRSLALMRRLSPEYLRRFLSHVDTLLWLDQANQKYTPVKAKTAPRSKQKK